jgi:hypothetical protein
MTGKFYFSRETRREKGSVVAYILIALFLTGLLVAAMSTGAKKSADTSQIDEMMLYAAIDIKTIQGGIDECVQLYPASVDVDGSGTINAADNPNPPFPLYCADGACALATMANSGAGTAITSAGCPGAPNGQRVIFSGKLGNKLRLLEDTATYTTTYVTDATEGVYMRITRAASDPLWTETIRRLNGKFSQCSAAAVTAAGACVNGCFYYWFVRRATSVLGGEVGCP